MEFVIKSVVFLPLVAALLVGLNSQRLTARTAQVLTASLMVISALLAVITFIKVSGQGQEYQVHLMNWIVAGSFESSWALRVDVLSALMMLLVTGVSAMVHLYSIGYMSHDPHPQRFMAYLSLFTFAMLMLVTADNFVQLFFGWEGVGLCSYLLIGFWYKKPSANKAAMKAFIVNRVGDIGLALGIFTLYLLFDSVRFDDIFGLANTKKDVVLQFLGMEIHGITLACILLFIGAMGKSAQFGLHTWLPDAMEGPTPVSALIHAATMVTAGVFLVARCSPLFELSPVALAVVTFVGAFTALFAATVAITQNDIKRVIAYSTCSQLGYMFFACGVSAYSAGMFHLFTHGFFKALLFLGAGSVIHAMSDEQDMRHMGGIWRKVPLTYAMMLIGTVAIIGWPPLSGYYSKDAVLFSAYAAGAEGGHPLGMFAYWVGIVAALLTSFYSWRLIFMTFHGQPRASSKVMSHVHESPLIMTLPLIVLAVGAVGLGAFFYHHFHIVGGEMTFWRGAVTMFGAEFNVLEAAHHIPVWAQEMPLVVGVVGFIAAWLGYLKFKTLPGIASRLIPGLFTFLKNKWFIDELYHYVFVLPAGWLGRVFWKRGDVGIVDRFGPNGVAAACKQLAVRASNVQTGYVYHYAFSLILGLVALLGLMWLLLLGVF